MCEFICVSPDVGEATSSRTNVVLTSFPYILAKLFSLETHFNLCMYCWASDYLGTYLQVSVDSFYVISYEQERKC